MKKDQKISSEHINQWRKGLRNPDRCVRAESACKLAEAGIFDRLILDILKEGVRLIYDGVKFIDRYPDDFAMRAFTAKDFYGELIERYEEDHTNENIALRAAKLLGNYENGESINETWWDVLGQSNEMDQLALPQLRKSVTRPYFKKQILAVLQGRFFQSRSSNNQPYKDNKLYDRKRKAIDLLLEFNLLDSSIADALLKECDTAYMGIDLFLKRSHYDERLLKFLLQDLDYGEKERRPYADPTRPDKKYLNGRQEHACNILLQLIKSFPDSTNLLADKVAKPNPKNLAAFIYVIGRIEQINEKLEGAVLQSLSHIVEQSTAQYRSVYYEDTEEWVLLIAKRLGRKGMLAFWEILAHKKKFGNDDFFYCVLRGFAEIQETLTDSMITAIEQFLNPEKKLRRDLFRKDIDIIRTITNSCFASSRFKLVTLLIKFINTKLDNDDIDNDVYLECIRAFAIFGDTRSEVAAILLKASRYQQEKTKYKDVRYAYRSDAEIRNEALTALQKLQIKNESSVLEVDSRNLRKKGNMSQQMLQSKLVIAIENGKIEQVVDLVENKGASAIEPNEKGIRPINAAVWSLRPDIIEYLIKKNEMNLENEVETIKKENKLLYGALFKWSEPIPETTFLAWAKWCTARYKQFPFLKGPRFYSIYASMYRLREHDSLHVHAYGELKKVVEVLIEDKDKKERQFSVMWDYMRNSNIDKNYLNVIRSINQQNQQALERTKKLLGISVEAIESVAPIEFETSEETKDEVENEMHVIPTVRDGDCAFHAIKGEWDSDRQSYYCKDVAVQRKKVVEAIRHAKSGDKIFKLVGKAVEEEIIKRQGEKRGPMKNRVGEYQQNEGRKSLRASQFELMKKKQEQTGWNCFDIAVGFNDRFLTENEKIRLNHEEKAARSRQIFVEKVLEKSNDMTYRRLLADEIRHVAAATVSTLNANLPLNNFHLPLSMQTDELKRIIKEYDAVHERLELIQARTNCNQALGAAREAYNQERNCPREFVLSTDELYIYFQNEQHRQQYRQAYDNFINAYNAYYLPYVNAFYAYCERKDIYQAYVREYYGKNQWFAFQPSASGQTSSMIDIAAIILKTQIIIFQKIEGNNKEIYRTQNNNTENGITRIEFVGSNHFTAFEDEPNASLDLIVQESLQVENKGKIGSTMSTLSASQPSQKNLSSIPLLEVNTLVQQTYPHEPSWNQKKETSDGVLESQQGIIEEKELTSLQELTEEYRKFLKAKNEQEAAIWNVLEKLLIQNQKLKLHIENGSNKKTFKEKFLDCLDKHREKIQEFISSHLLIQEKFNQYYKISRFDWAKKINTKIIREYADTKIKKSGNELSVIEIEIIAHALNITINFYSKETKNKIVFNPGQTEKIAIQFDGVNHFLGMVDKKDYAKIERDLQVRLEESKEQYNKAIFSDLPEEVKCGLCEKILEEPIVKCIDKEIDRYFHEGCLKSHFNKNVLGSNSTSKQILLCGKIIVREYERISALELRTIKRILSDHGISSENGKSADKDRADSYKALLIIRDQAGSLFSQEGSTFGDVQLRETLADFEVIEQNGKLKFDVDKYIERRRERYQNPASELKYYGSSVVRYGMFAASPYIAGSSLAVLGYYQIAVLGTTTNAYLAGAAAESLLGAVGKGAVSSPFALSIGVGALAFMGGSIYSKYEVKKFKENIRMAVQHFDDGIRQRNRKEHESVERILKAEFGEGEDGKYGVSRGLRWFNTNYEEYAFAHYLRAENAVILADEIAYEEYVKAYNDAKDVRTIAAASLIGCMKLLSPHSENKVQKVENRIITDAERNQLLMDKTRELHRNYPEIVKHYFDNVAKLCRQFLVAIQDEKKLRELVNDPSINSILSFRETYFFQYLEPHGKMCEIIILFLQGVFCVLLKQYGMRVSNHIIEKSEKICVKSDTKLEAYQLSYYLSARLRFEECWMSIMKYGFHKRIDQASQREGIQEEIILKQIKDYIYSFFTRCHEREIFNDNLIHRMREIGLIEDIRSPLLEEEVVSMLNENVSLLEEIKDFNSLEILLRKISSSDDISKLRFPGNRNWLHTLCSLKFDPSLKDLVKEAIIKVLSIGISPYERTIEGNTTFMCISKEDSYEINSLLPRENQFFGVEKQVQTITNFLKRVSANPDVDQHFLLLSGPPGTGKTEIVKKITKECQFDCVEFERGNSDDKYVGQLATRITKFFDDAKNSKKTVCLFIDEIDAICPEYQGSPSRGGYDPDATVTLIQMEISRLKSHKVVLIGATNYLQKLKGAIQNRAGSPVVFNLPNKAIRKKIIEHKLRLFNLENSLIIERLAECTSGWSPRLLSNYLDNVINRFHQGTFQEYIYDQYFIAEFDPMRETLKSEHLEVELDPPKLQLEPGADPFQNLVGLDPTVEKQLRKLCVYLDNPQPYTERLTEVNKNILLYGPPGTGKTSFARAVASHSHVMFIYIDGGKYKLQGSEHLIKGIFSLAKSYERAIIFIDEIDAITQDYSSVREVLQTEIDGFSKKKDNILTIIGATNYLSKISPAILSRFIRVEVPLPSKEQRIKLFRYYLTEVREKNPFEISFINSFNIACEQLADRCAEFSPRDIKKIIEIAVDDLITKEQLTNQKVSLAFNDITDAMSEYQPPESNVKMSL